MAIEIFTQEILDGISHMVAKANCIAYTSEVKTCRNDNKTEIEKLFKKAIASDRPEQEDLFYIESILVSTGWNKNDDVFLPAETWPARKSPEDKQFNFMHNEKDIIGHMVSNMTVDFEGNEIPDDVLETPDKFEIKVGSVIYISWQDIELQDRINKIVEGIKNNEWCVSMECLFKGFDYALQSPDGETRIVTRSEANAYLTKHLRAYGGTGVVNGYKIGRALKSMTFSGKGLVDNPANPRSVILEKNDEEKSTSAIMENNMDKDKQIEELQAQLAEAKAAVEALNSIKTKAESLEATLADKDTAIATATSEITELKAAMATLQQTVEALNKDKCAMDDEMKNMKKKMKNEKRKAALVGAGLEDSEAEETVAGLDAVDDEAFDKVVSVMSKNKKTEAAVDTTSEETETEDNSEAALEDAEVDKTEAITETEEEDKTAGLKATASSWFGGLLQTTKNLK